MSDRSKQAFHKDYHQQFSNSDINQDRDLSNPDMDLEGQEENRGNENPSANDGQIDDDGWVHGQNRGSV